MAKDKTGIYLADRKQVFLFLGILMLFGFLIRMPLNDWGNPYMLHPDEGCVVNNTMDMISRKSFETYVFDRPDHFEIKLDSVVFNLVSYLKFGCSASEAFSMNAFFFYFLARVVTMCFGIGMIPIVYCIGRRMGVVTGYVAAAAAAFMPAFVEHSGYATPDIPLTFFSVLTLLFAMKYLEDDRFKWLAAMCFCTAVAITIKYTGAILCFLIALAVIQKRLQECGLKNAIGFILRRGVYAIGCVLLGIYLVSPVLFTNFEAVYRAFTAQAGGVHPGLDGLGFSGKLLFYVQCMGGRLGILFAILSVTGAYYLFKEKNTYRFLVLSGVVFWICLSIPSLHAERWSLPMYITPLFFGAFGFAKLTVLRKKAAVLFGAVILANMWMNCGCVVLEKTAQNARIYTYDWCMENGIRAEQSIAEGYTPFYMGGAANIYQNFSVENGEIQVINEELKGREYVVLGGMNLRYYEDKERFEDILRIYDAIRSQYEPVKKFPAVKRDYRILEPVNIFECVTYIQKAMDAGYVGDAIEIYRINQR